MKVIKKFHKSKLIEFVWTSTFLCRPTCPTGQSAEKDNVEPSVGLGFDGDPYNIADNIIKSLAIICGICQHRNRHTERVILSSQSIKSSWG